MQPDLLVRHKTVWKVPKRLERRTRAGESPVGELACGLASQLKYHATREIAWEAGATTSQGYQYWS